MQFDTQMLIEFCRAMLDEKSNHIGNFDEIIDKIADNPPNTPWQPFLNLDQSQRAIGQGYVDSLASQLRDFNDELQQTWLRLRAGPRNETTAGDPAQAFHDFLDLGSSHFRTLAKSDEFSEALSGYINAMADGDALTIDPISEHFLRSAPAHFAKPQPAARNIVLQSGTMTVYHYAPTVRRRKMKPLLIVYALINSADIVDLDAERSLIRGLLHQGLPVYLIDWGFASRNDAGLGLSTYIHERLKPAIDVVRDDSGSDQVNLMGICQGGVMSLAAASLYPEVIDKVALVVTPIDYHTPDDLLSRWIRDIDISKLVSKVGVVPGPLLYWLFASLNPFELIYRKYLNAATLVSGRATIDETALEPFLRMENWVQNVPDHAGRALDEFATQLYQQNALINDTFCIDSKPIRLAELRQPIINFYGSRDHIVPPQAARALAAILQQGNRKPGDYEEIALDGGHIGSFVSRRNIIRIAERLGTWL